MKKNFVKNLAAVGVMTVLSVGIIFGIRLSQQEKPEVVEAISLGGFTSTDATIMEAGQVLNEEGAVDAYVVTVSSIGFNPEKPMVFKLRFDATATTLLNYEVVEHGETPTLGGKLGNEEFVTAINGVTAPVYIDGQEEVGTKIDGITGATISTEAAVRAINGAQSFLRKEVLKMEDVEAISVGGFTSEDATVEEAGKVIGDNGEVESYVVTVSSTGFATEPIVLKLKFDLTGDTLLQYQVVSHNETPSLGGKIFEEPYTSTFTGIAVPVYVEGQEEVGTKIDGVTGATITSEAVVRSINCAQEFLKSEVLNVEPIEVGEFAIEDAKIEEAGKVIGDNGEVEAYVVTVSSTGFAGSIVLNLKFDVTGSTLVNYAVVSQNETPGLGGKIEEEEFASVLNDIAAPVYVEGQDEAATKIDGISGATISTEAVVRGINCAYEFLQSSVLN